MVKSKKQTKTEEQLLDDFCSNKKLTGTNPSQYMNRWYEYLNKIIPSLPQEYQNYLSLLSEAVIVSRITKAKSAKRKTKIEKIALIAAHLKEQPYASSPEIESATGIDESDVRRLWGPIRQGLKEAKRYKPPGSKDKGKLEAEDKSASCSICRMPLDPPFECKLCNDIIKGECKECHYTNTHSDDAIP